VKYLPARVEEVIGNDAAVTSPPHRLGTHNGDSVPLPKAHQLNCPGIVGGRFV
jgi:hypothetical protein